MNLVIMTFFIPVFFAFSLLIAFIIRKRLIEKVMFLEIDEDLKNLSPREFFYNILKIEKFAKPVYYVEIFFFLLVSIVIAYQCYNEYLKKLEFMKDNTDFSNSTISFILPELTISLVIWFIITALLLFAFIMKRRENKRITEMLDNLEKFKLLKYAKEDFINSDRIVETGMLGNDIKLGDKYLFVIYPAYIIPYSWLDDVEVGEIYGRYGSRAFYVNIILKKSFKSIKITFAKKKVCEKIREFLLKNK